jgi:hypothetical protein
MHLDIEAIARLARNDDPLGVRLGSGLALTHDGAGGDGLLLHRQRLRRVVAPPGEGDQADRRQRHQQDQDGGEALQGARDHGAAGVFALFAAAAA